MNACAKAAWARFPHPHFLSTCIASTDDYHAMILDVGMYHVVIVQVCVTKN